jgi:hypothetical protein
MDLLSAVIIGAERTPYYDGLFFFDLYFPSPIFPPGLSLRIRYLTDSIQGLVLTENPGLILAETPFLEQPVVWKSTPLEKSLSRKHNKDYFTKSSLLTEQIIRRPPKV